MMDAEATALAAAPQMNTTGEMTCAGKKALKDSKVARFVGYEARPEYYRREFELMMRESFVY
jgi:hypothetical protein